MELGHLGGGLGILSAGGAAECDWMPLVLRDLDGVPAEGRGCRYVCAAAIARPGGSEDVVRGVVEGHIADAPRGDGGFGYDPLVVTVEGDGRTFGEMTEAAKRAIRHRARALTDLHPRLRAAAATPPRRPP